MHLETRYCTLCGPNAPKNIKFPPKFSESDLNADIFSARRMPDRRHFRLVECGQCGIIYSDPVCDPALLASVYQQSFVNYGSQEEQIYESYAPVLDRAMQHLSPTDVKTGSFLEIGGGTGFMLRYGAHCGFSQQIEVEPSADAAKKFVPSSSQSKFIHGIFVPGVLPPSSVKFACFFQMLDHVPNPLDFLKSVYEVLEPGGVAVCITHNTNAFSARLLGERSPIYDIEHTYLFNIKNIAQLFSEVGFEKVEAFPVANRYALKYWMNMAPLPRFLKQNIILPVLNFTQLGEIKIKLNAGNLGAIAIKPHRSN